MNISFQLKTKQLICVIFLLLCFISGANGQFKKVEGLDVLGVHFLETFQKDGNNYLTLGYMNDDYTKFIIEINKWNANSFDHHQLFTIKDVSYEKINFFYHNNEPYFILSGHTGIDIYRWNEVDEALTHIQNIFKILPFLSHLQYFELNNTPWFAFYSSDEKIWVYEWDGTQFEDKTNFSSPGATLRPLYVDDTQYLITTFIGEPTKIYKWKGVRFMISNDFQVSSVNKTLENSFIYKNEQFFLFFTSPWNEERGDTFEIDRWNGESLEQAYTGTTKADTFNTFLIGERQFVSLPEDSMGNFTEEIYEWKDNQLVYYQTIEIKESSFSEYFTIDGKHYLILSSFNNYPTLYEWQSSEEQKKASLSDVICILQVLAGNECGSQPENE